MLTRAGAWASSTFDDQQPIRSPHSASEWALSNNGSENKEGDEVMKALSYTVAASVLASMIGVSSAIADGIKAVIVINNTSYALNELYASASANGDWDTTTEPNLIAGTPLGPGLQTTIAITDGSADCSYDLMGVLDTSPQAPSAGDRRTTFGSNQVNACIVDTWTINQ
jgi:hypothetical protein